MILPRTSLLIAALQLLGPVQAKPARPPPHSTIYVHPTNGICKDYSITKEISAPVPVLGRAPFESNLDIAELLINSTRISTDGFTPSPFTGFENATRSYTISGTFCSPKKLRDGKETTVLLATHGIMYDRRYWASSYKPEEYNFAQFALGSGYSVFYYDRIGTGKSQIPSGYELSIPGQAALLAQVAASIRAGSYTSTIRATKLVLVGHSYGSQLSQHVLQAAPQLVDAAILTGIGYTANPATSSLLSHLVLTIFAGRLANSVDPPWRRDNSYFAFADVTAHAHGFFYPPFDTKTLEYAHSIYQPGAVGEVSFVPSPQEGDPEDPLAGIRVDDFAGPVLLASGRHDLVCSGDCNATYHDEYALQGKVFPRATPLETYVHEGAGHGVNFARNATGFYGVLMGFLDKNLTA